MHSIAALSALVHFDALPDGTDTASRDLDLATDEDNKSYYAILIYKANVAVSSFRYASLSPSAITDQQIRGPSLTPMGSDEV